MIGTRCVICGAELPADMEQLIFATAQRGIESSCLCHEYSKALKDYVESCGGAISIWQGLHKEYWRKDECR